MVRISIITLAGLWALLATTVWAQGPEVHRGQELDRYYLPAVDEKAIRAADERRARLGGVPHYAWSMAVDISPWGNVGTWESMRDGRARWRLRLTSPGALSLNLAFHRFQMPPGGELWLRAVDGRRQTIGPFTELDNELHGQLWTPPLETDDLVLELILPVDEIDNAEIQLTQVHHGYAGFGEPEPKAGDCHRDVACDEATSWSDQARSVALISVAGNRFCSGFLVNNTAHDGRPFFITASHCGVTPGNAASVVVLWNHERQGCGADKPLKSRRLQFQTGAVFRASHRFSDTVLLELDDLPDPSFGVFYAGWDRSTEDPERSTVIHHPNTDVKRISFDFDPAVTTQHLKSDSTEGGDHLRVIGWDVGSTEGGSSGAPLFNDDRRVVGQLHGGYASCEAPRSDWFGRFSAAWTGRGRLGFRLSDWLDPLDSGAVAIDGLDGAALRVAGPGILAVD